MEEHDQHLCFHTMNGCYAASRVRIPSHTQPEKSGRNQYDNPNMLPDIPRRLFLPQQTLRVRCRRAWLESIVGALGQDRRWNLYALDREQVLADTHAPDQVPSTVLAATQECHEESRVRSECSNFEQDGTSAI